MMEQTTHADWAEARRQDRHHDIVMIGVRHAMEKLPPMTLVEIGNWARALADGVYPATGDRRHVTDSDRNYWIEFDGKHWVTIDAPTDPVEFSRRPGPGE